MRVIWVFWCALAVCIFLLVLPGCSSNPLSFPCPSAPNVQPAPKVDAAKHPSSWIEWLNGLLEP